MIHIACKLYNNNMRLSWWHEYWGRTHYSTESIDPACYRTLMVCICEIGATSFSDKWQVFVYMDIHVLLPNMGMIDTINVLTQNSYITLSVSHRI